MKILKKINNTVTKQYKPTKMNESVIIQKLIQVGQMLERGELEYSGAEADTKHYLEKYVALYQPVGRSEQLLCGDLMKHNFSLSKIGICYECKFIKDRAK